MLTSHRTESKGEKQKDFFNHFAQASYFFFYVTADDLKDIENSMTLYHVMICLKKNFFK